MDQINFLRKYFNDYRNLTLFDNKTLELIVKTKNILLKLKRDKKSIDFWKWRQCSHCKPF